MDKTVIARQLLFVALLMLFVALALTFVKNLFPWNLILLVCSSLLIASSFYQLKRIQGNSTLVKTIHSEYSLEEVYQTLILILNEDKILYSVKNSYTIILTSPFEGTIELKKLVHEPPIETHFDNLGAALEFWFDFHTNKYELLAQRAHEMSETIVIKASPLKLETIVQKLVERLRLM